MSFASQIGLSLDLLMQNVSRLQEQAAVLPSSYEVGRVEGADQEYAQNGYRQALALRAGQLAQAVEDVRRFVETNAQALDRAAQNLQSTDGEQSLAARQASAFLDGIAADAAAAEAAAASQPPAPTRPGSGSQAW